MLQISMADIPPANHDPFAGLQYNSRAPQFRNKSYGERQLGEVITSVVCPPANSQNFRWATAIYCAGHVFQFTSGCCFAPTNHLRCMNHYLHGAQGSCQLRLSPWSLHMSHCNDRFEQRHGTLLLASDSARWILEESWSKKCVSTVV